MRKAVSALFSFYNWLIIRLCSGHVSSTADMFILLIKIKFKVKNVVTEPQMRVAMMWTRFQLEIHRYYEANPFFFDMWQNPLRSFEPQLATYFSTNRLNKSCAYKWGDVVTRDPPIKWSESISGKEKQFIAKAGNFKRFSRQKPTPLVPTTLPSTYPPHQMLFRKTKTAVITGNGTGA